MNAHLHRLSAENIEFVEEVIEKLIGYPADVPYCFTARISRLDKSVKKEVVKHLKDLLNEQLNLQEAKENKEHTKKFKELVELLITFYE